MKTIGLITAGGDCAGINAVLSSIVKVGVPKGYNFIGFNKGWEGTLTPIMSRPLGLEDVRGISHLGGTILKTTNHGRFAAKVGRGETHAIDPAILQESKRNIESLGIEGLIVIGGDGSLSGASQLAELGVKIVGVPKTIDNDLSTTDLTFGFSTAVSVAVDALDKIHTTATSHGRVFLVECMGRTAGWITLYAGLSAGADAILLPEFDLNLDTFVSFLDQHMQSHGSAVIAVAEGMSLRIKTQVNETAAENQMVGASYKLMHMIERQYPGKFELRNVILGHTQRGGGPNAEDRVLAKQFGITALEAYEQGKFGQVVSIRNGQITTVPLTNDINIVKKITRENPLYKAAQSLGVYVN
jgi:6-phosphofructokinase